MKFNSEGSALVLQVPLKKKKYMGPPLSWIMPFSKYRKVSLDSLGQEVWTACDGKRTTEQIIEEFADRHFVSFHEARLSIMEFLRQLMRRGLIVLVGYEEE